MADILEVLQPNHAKLLAQFDDNYHTVASLQTTLLHQIIPNMNLSPSEQDLASSYVDDFNSMFYMLRRHEFTLSFALEAIQRNIEWRLSNVPSAIPSMILSLSPDSDTLCLPPSSARDPHNRPILVIQLKPAPATATRKEIQQNIVLSLESLRLTLSQLNPQSTDSDAIDFYDSDSSSDKGKSKGKSRQPQQQPILQYVVLLDVANLSMRNMDMEMSSWIARDLLPHFPGMLGAVFMINYSWAHSGLWRIVKRLLPAQALSRVFFPTQQELIHVFGKSNLPQDFGGSLPPLSALRTPPPSLRPPSPPPPPHDETPQSQPDKTGRFFEVSVPRLSSLNPFFGYPTTIITSSTSHPPRYITNRNLVQLLRTLAWLYWRRWKRAVLWLICLCAVMLSSLLVAQRNGKARAALERLRRRLLAKLRKTKH